MICIMIFLCLPFNLTPSSLSPAGIKFGETLLAFIKLTGERYCEEKI